MRKRKKRSRYELCELEPLFCRTKAQLPNDLSPLAFRRLAAEFRSLPPCTGPLAGAYLKQLIGFEKRGGLLVIRVWRAGLLASVLTKPWNRLIAAYAARTNSRVPPGKLRGPSCPSHLFNAIVGDKVLDCVRTFDTPEGTMVETHGGVSVDEAYRRSQWTGLLPELGLNSPYGIAQEESLALACESLAAIIERHLAEGPAPKKRNTSDRILALERLRQAIQDSPNGKGSKPKKIIQLAQINPSKGRSILRDLEKLGEYAGFARPRPERFRGSSQSNAG